MKTFELLFITHFWVCCAMAETTSLSCDENEACLSNFSHPNLRGLRKGDEYVCIDLGGSKGKQTFMVPHDKASWCCETIGASDGATMGECNPSEVKSLKDKLMHEDEFCYTFTYAEGGECTIKAPLAARKWLENRGAIAQSCQAADSALRLKLVPGLFSGSPQSNEYHKVCIDLGRNRGKQTFMVPQSKVDWFCKSIGASEGGTKGACYPGEVKSLKYHLKHEEAFCYSFLVEEGGQDCTIYAPEAARKWLQKRGAAKKDCPDTGFNGPDVVMRLIE